MPGERGGFSLDGYTEVKDRVALFYKAWPEGRLVTDRVELWLEVEPPRVVVKALAYRTPDDPHPGTGWSWMTLPGKTPYTNGSEIENTETSAWGRAIGSLGIGIGGSIGSADEVRGKAGEEPKATDASGETVKSLGPIERVGAIAKGTGRHSDLEWRQTPDGYHIGFLLEVGDNKAKPQVYVDGPLAVALYAATSGMPLNGMKVTVKGELSEVRAPNRRVLYRIHATGLETDEWILPANVDANSVATGSAEPANDGAPGLPVAAQPSAGEPASVPATDDDLSDLPEEWRQPEAVA
jgi:hypothetical protein